MGLKNEVDLDLTFEPTVPHKWDQADLVTALQ